MNIENLPDELLCQVFNTLFFEDISVSNKFKLASVSPQFRRCILSNFKVPFPLVANFTSELLNGNRIPIRRWPQAVRVLAKQAQFSEITIKLHRSPPSKWDAATKILEVISKSDCISQLCYFHDDRLMEQDAHFLQRTLHGAKKLSKVHLGLMCWTGMTGTCHFLESLARILVGKPIIELAVFAMDDSRRMLDFFRFAELRSLAHLNLHFGVGLERQSTPFPALLNHLNLSALETIHFTKPGLQPTEGMFAQIAQLPALTKCRLDLDVSRRRPLADCVNSFFANLPTQPLHPRSLELWVSKRASERHLMCTCDMHQFASERHLMCTCDMRQFIRAVRAGTTNVQTNVHTNIEPGVGALSVIQFETMHAEVVISNIWLMHKRHLQSQRCKSSYNHLLAAFTKETHEDEPAMYLQDAYLDRCKITRLLADLNMSQKMCPGSHAFTIYVHNTRDWVTVTYTRGQDTFATQVETCFCPNPDCTACLDV